MSHIEQIPAYLVWPIRHQVMYPELEPEDVKFKNDDDGIHFGLFDHDKLITVVSLFRQDDEMQFRKFATLNGFQGMGYGSQMLEYLISYTKEQGCIRLWCNARKSAAAFYQKYGFSETGEEFAKNGYEFVIMELYLN